VPFRQECQFQRTPCRHRRSRYRRRSFQSGCCRSHKTPEMRPAPESSPEVARGSAERSAREKTDLPKGEQRSIFWIAGLLPRMRKNVRCAERGIASAKDMSGVIVMERIIGTNLADTVPNSKTITGPDDTRHDMRNETETDVVNDMAIDIKIMPEVVRILTEQTIRETNRREERRDERREDRRDERKEEANQASPSGGEGRRSATSVVRETIRPRQRPESDGTVCAGAPWKRK